MASSNMWDIFDHILDQTQERNVCQEMAVKITGEEDIEVFFSMSSDPSEEYCSVDSLSEDPSSYFEYSEPSNSLLLEEEVDENRARKHGKNKHVASISRTSTTMTTETDSTRSISNTLSGKTLSNKSVLVDIEDFQEEQERRDQDRRQRRQRRQQENEDDIDEQDLDDQIRDNSNTGPLQRKASEETEDSDIDDSLVFEDDFDASFDENDNDTQVYDADDLVMELVDDDDIDDDDALTRLIDIHIGDMYDGSSHMDKISMRLRPTFELPPMPAPATGLVDASNTAVVNTAVTPIHPNHSKSNSKRRNQLSLPQIVEQESEDEPEGSERQACIEEIEDPRLRTLLKTISRRSKCSERFDMDALMEHLQDEGVQDPSVHKALRNLTSRMRNSDPKSTSSTGSQIEEIDLDLFFEDIRQGVQQESRHDAPTKRNLAAPAEDRDNVDLIMQISDDIVLERGMSSLSMGHNTCISSSTIEDSLMIRALNTPLGTTHNGNSENKFHSVSIFNRNKSKKQGIEKKHTTEESSIQPFSTLSNKGNLSKLKHKLTRNSSKMGKTVGKLLSITPHSSSMENSAPVTPATLCMDGSDSSLHDAAELQESSDKNSSDKNFKTNPSRKNRMTQLWQKTKKGAIGRRGDTYHTLDPIGERLSA